MKDTNILSTDQEQKILKMGAAIEITTDNLKERFKEGSIPLQTDFNQLIDIADVGRKAVGLAPGQEGGPGPGLQLGSTALLSVKLKTNSGLTADNNGLSAKPGRGMEVTTEGIRITEEFAFQKGMILMFSGSIVPIGWLFCDGTNNTPDLRDRFIAGSTTINAEDSGGSTDKLSGERASKQYEILTTKVKTGVDATVIPMALNTKQLPEHSHYDGMRYYQDLGFSSYYSQTMENKERSMLKNTIDNVISYDKNNGGDVMAYLFETSTSGKSEEHTHNISIVEPAHGHSVNMVPPYYLLAFIMKA
ncbi:tail fiber protein [Yersinia pseudotuberculosis]|uniref:tail fiber protein n=1 Tax=Yersinia pseudotuberculosis TaxID=633 RepID=UPI0005DC90CC|nr:tail fiber protein [Yersinia pseudotuberculosis]CND35852.1 Uncharacterised protein [Yersinia pseudotuberculosis]